MTTHPSRCSARTTLSQTTLGSLVTVAIGDLGSGGKHGIILDRLKIELDGLADILEGFIAGRAFGDAAGKAGNSGGESPVLGRLEHDFEIDRHGAKSPTFGQKHVTK